MELERLRLMRLVSCFRALALGPCLLACMPAAEDVNPSVEFAGEILESWASYDDAMKLRELGVTVPMALIEELNESGGAILPFPEMAQEQSGFSALGLDYLLEGHGPQPYLMPHFDMHFYANDADTREAIDCENEPMPDASRIPSPYLIPGTSVEPDGSCVPGMGIHAVNLDSPELAMENPATFTETFILGYHDGEMVFVEPMVSQAFLREKQDWSFALPAPESLGDSIKMYPSRFEGRFQADDTLTLTLYFE